MKQKGIRWNMSLNKKSKRKEEKMATSDTASVLNTEFLDEIRKQYQQQQYQQQQTTIWGGSAVGNSGTVTYPSGTAFPGSTIAYPGTVTYPGFPTPAPLTATYDHQTTLLLITLITAVGPEMCRRLLRKFCLEGLMTEIEFETLVKKVTGTLSGEEDPQLDQAIEQAVKEIKV